jgi:starch phosphorylase
MIAEGQPTEPYVDAQGKYRVTWVAETVVEGAACDTPIQGYLVRTC